MSNYCLRTLLVCIALFSASQKVLAGSVTQATISIIIDDLGHHYHHGVALAEMPYPLTLSFLPHRRYTKKLAELAHQRGKEIMLHAPMENSRGFDLGYGGLTSTMSQQDIHGILASNLSLVPYAKGVNNHMGSALTENAQVMQWFMQSLARTHHYFVDSKTSAKSVAAKLAKRNGIPTLTRDIFLDHLQTKEYMTQQFAKLIAIAQRRGHAIAIGHPHKSTVQFLKNALPTLGEQGIAVASISGLWKIIHRKQDLRLASNLDI